MSIETTEETFAALTKGLDYGLNCDVHKGGHKAEWFFESECPACATTSTAAVCADQYYQTVADKDKRVITCMSCETLFKPFEILQTTRKVG